MMKQEREIEHGSEFDFLYKRIRDFSLRDPSRSARWLKYIKGHPCLRCELSETEPHHFCGSVQNLKSSDIFTVPVCRSCHEFYESHPSFNSLLIEKWIYLAHDWIKGEVSLVLRIAP